MPELLNHKETKPNKQSERDKKNEIRKQHDFYRVKATKDGILDKIIIKKARLIDKLLDYQFFRFDIDNDTSAFIHVIENRVREVNREQIIDRFFDEVKKLPDYTHETVSDDKTVSLVVTAEIIRQALFENIAEYFSKALLYRLVSPKPITIKTDTRTEKFFYYRNGFVKATPNGYKLHPYSELDEYIWDNQKLNRDFNENTLKGDWERFIERVCGHISGEMEPTMKKRFESLRSIIGYCLHGFFDYKLYATILTDARIGEDDEANGRTGKTLFAKGLGQMLNFNKDAKVYCEINGKDFDPRDKHRYGFATMETQLININDLSKSTSVEVFFNDITEGVTVDKKNEKPFRVMAKMIISTNKTLKIEGESAKDRIIQFEFSDYYSSKRSPLAEFGKWMFSNDWTETDWNQFDTFMIQSCCQYIRTGVIEADSINLKRRTLIDHTCKEFVEWMDDFIRHSKAIAQSDILELTWGEKMDKKRVFEFFIRSYGDDFKTLKQRTFTIWIKRYCIYNAQLEPISSKNGTEERSNGIDWITFKKRANEIDQTNA